MRKLHKVCDHSRGERVPLAKLRIVPSRAVAFARHYEITRICRCIIHRRFATRVFYVYSPGCRNIRENKREARSQASSRYYVVPSSYILASWSKNVRNVYVTSEMYNYHDLWRAINKILRDIFVESSFSFYFLYKSRGNHFWRAASELQVIHLQRFYSSWSYYLELTEIIKYHTSLYHHI